MLPRQGLKFLSALLITLTLVAPAAMAGVGVTSSKDPVRLVINIPSRTLWVYEGERIVRYFPVGVGRPGFMTPTGQFSIIRKIIDPGWEHPYQPKGKVRIAPGENNPLGTRWMGFYQKGGGEYGMHGTDNPASVGKFSSHGCVRMKVKDAEALFEMVDIGTPVDVVYEPVLIRPQGKDMRIVVYQDRFKKGMPSAAEIQARILRQYPGAQVTPEKIQAALRQANERPIVVGTLDDGSETPVAAKTPVQEHPPTRSSPFEPADAPQLSGTSKTAPST
jgi:hypothetical protein